MMIKIKNLKTRDNKNWKRIADIALYVLPLELATVAALPITDNAKFWLGFIIAQVTVIFKAISKFSAEPDSITTESVVNE